MPSSLIEIVNKVVNKTVLIHCHGVDSPVIRQASNKPSQARRPVKRLLQCSRSEMILAWSGECTGTEEREN